MTRARVLAGAAVAAVVAVVVGVAVLWPGGAPRPSATPRPPGVTPTRTSAADSADRHAAAVATGQALVPQVEALAHLGPGEHLSVRDAFPNPDATTGLRYDRRLHGLPVDGEQVLVRLEKDGRTVTVIRLPAVALDTVGDVGPGIPAATAEHTVAASSARPDRETRRSRLVVLAMAAPARLAWEVTTAVDDGAGAQDDSVTFVDAETGAVLEQRALAVSGQG